MWCKYLDHGAKGPSKNKEDWNLSQAGRLMEGFQEEETQTEIWRVTMSCLPEKHEEGGDAGREHFR